MRKVICDSCGDEMQLPTEPGSDKFRFETALYANHSPQADKADARWLKAVVDRDGYYDFCDRCYIEGLFKTLAAKMATMTPRPY